MRLYSIYSKTSKLFDTPFPCDSDTRCVYELRNMINTMKESPISVFADEHSLFCVGIFDPEKGKLKPVSEVVVKDLSTLKKKDGDSSVSIGV